MSDSPEAAAALAQPPAAPLGLKLLLGDRRFLAALATRLGAEMAIIAFVSSSSLAAVTILGLTPMQDRTAAAAACTIALFGAGAFVAERRLFGSFALG